MTAPTLVVPIQVDALAVSKGVADRDEFLRWPFAYSNLPDFASAEARPYGLNPSRGQEGIYLHWVVPQALRHGRQDATPGTQDRRTGSAAFRLVPNRWLVARFPTAQPGAAKAWVVESDCPWSTAVDTALGVQQEGGVAYVVDPDVVAAWAESADPYRTAAAADAANRDTYIARLGVPFPLGSWPGRALDPAHDGSFLTAVAPANAAFSIFTPHNSGVFSLYDAATDVDPGQVSYVVVGWYANLADDPLASWQSGTSKDPYDDLLAELRWTVLGQDPAQPTPPADRAGRSLYQGMAMTIQWDAGGSAPEPDPLPDTGTSTALNVAIGNTTIDAFTALVATTKGIKPGAQALLRAFQYDLLPVLDQPNGPAVLARRIRQAWFGSASGGYSWSIVDAAHQDKPAALSPTEENWLADLNQAQWSLDRALEDLYQLQWRVHELWWKAGRFPQLANPPAAVDADAIAQQLDPTQVDGSGNPGPANQLMAQLATVSALAQAVPQPIPAKTRQEAMQAGIQAYADAKGLDREAKLLKAVEAPRHWRANDPVVLLSGVQPPAESDPNQTLTTRLLGDTVTSLTVGGKELTIASLGAAVPSLTNANLPDGVSALVDEWFLLDPGNAQAIAAAASLDEAAVAAAIATRAAPAYTSSLPALGLAAWSQPWQPMYLEWQVEQTTIATKGPDGKPLWGFDGEDYRYVGGATPGDLVTQAYAGRSLLSPHAQFVLGSRLNDFVQAYGKDDPDLQALYQELFGDGADQAILTQALTGLMDQLSVRDGRAYRRPQTSELLAAGSTARAADVTGYTDAASSDPHSLLDRYRGSVGTVPYTPDDADMPFNATRQGQLHFTGLRLYDKFGRVLEVIAPGSESGLSDYKNFPAAVDGALRPATGEKIAKDVQSVVEVSPRLGQHARLDFDLRDVADDSKVLGRVAGVDPVGGWVLPNHLDRSLLLYAPDGTALGEYRLVETPAGTKTGHWSPPPPLPPPRKVVADRADVAAAAPLVGAMIDAKAIAGESAFDALLDVIDTTLWSTDPLGSRRDQTMTVLVGRPLALVRAGLGLSLRGAPIRDASWSNTLDPPEPDFMTRSFPVRLGDLATRDDGLVGYFTGDDYESFNSVAAPQETTPQDYVAPVGPPGIGGTNYVGLVPNAPATLLTMLVDPRAGVHATSGILPVTSTALPAAFVDAALSAIEVSFRIGPALTFVQPTPVVGSVKPANPQAVTLPAPAEQNGTWSFWDREPGWTSYDIVAATADAQLKPYPLALRDGLLQLITDLDQ